MSEFLTFSEVRQRLETERLRTLPLALGDDEFASIVIRLPKPTPVVHAIAELARVAC